jgi:PAS domain S-box-containing protein
MTEGFALLDPDFRIIDMNAEAMRYEVRPREEVIGKTHWEAHPHANPKLGELYQHGMVNRVPVSLEHRYVWPNGQVSWFSMHAYPVGDGLAVFYGDITKRVEAEERQKTLIDELNHRVKNTLATVQSLANQTFKGEHQDATARLTFEGRLFALAAAHDLLTREHWKGAELRDIATKSLAAYAQDGTNRFHIEGLGLRLPPRMALAIAMALGSLRAGQNRVGDSFRCAGFHPPVDRGRRPHGHAANPKGVRDAVDRAQSRAGTRRSSSSHLRAYGCCLHCGSAAG